MSRSFHSLWKSLTLVKLSAGQVDQNDLTWYADTDSSENPSKPARLVTGYREIEVSLDY